MKKLLTTFFIAVLVMSGGFALAQTTTSAVTTNDVRFGQFFGAAQSKLETMVSLIVDLYEEGLTKEEIVERIFANKPAVTADDSDEDVSDAFERFRIKSLNLRRGSIGENVSIIQRVINSLGINTGTISVDGKFGQNTEAAIKAFQRLMGLTEDGILGPKTRLKIKERLEEELRLRTENQGTSEDEESNSTTDSNDDSGEE